MAFAARRIRARRPIRTGNLQTSSLLLFILAGIALMGILAGSLWESFARFSRDEYAGYFVLQYLERYEYTSFALLLKALLWPALMPLLFLIYNSFCCIGLPFIFLVPFLKGFSMGSISGYLYATHGLHGMAAVLILFFVPQMMQLCAILILAQSASMASLGLLMHHFAGQSVHETFRLGQTVHIFAKTMLLMLLACVLEASLSIVFAPILLT